ncbi:MAG: acyltransferase [Sphingomonas sp.]|uniref:acyltransferase family protein n=1 Tax=Sphingomonas sp. TaxID=28214 RepID=UPI0035664938
MTKRTTYETLNGIRGAAAICVVIFHMHASFWPEQALSGYLAVDIFFVLSGFVLADAYGAKFAEGSLSTARFATMRLIRFYPLYLAGLALGIVKVLAQQGTGSENALPIASVPGAIASALLFLPAVGTSLTNIAPLNVPAWSLLYEFWVNVVWATISRRFTAPAQLVTALIAGAVFAGFAISAGNANLGPSWDGIVGGIARTIFSFTMGLLIYRTRAAVGRSSAPWSMLALLVVFILLFAAPSPSQRVAYDVVTALMLSPVIVFAASRVEPSEAFRPLFAWLGAISFPLYAIHAPLIAMGIFVVRKTHVMPQLGGASLLIALLATAWLGSLIDGWLQKRLKPITARRPPLA